MTVVFTNADRRRHGHTLVELIVGMAVSSLLLLSMGATVFLAMRAMPNPQKDPQASIVAGQIIDQITEELETALSVTQLTATTIAFTVPARGSDTNPERICYSWSGRGPSGCGGPLTRQYNGGAVVTIVPSVNLFALTPSSVSVQETYPSVATSTAAALLVSCTGTSGLGDDNVQTTQSLGQYFKPVVGSGVYAWQATSVQFMAKQVSGTGTTLVQMQPANATLTPNGVVNEQSTLPGASSAYTWESFSLAKEPVMAAGSGTCLVLLDKTGNPSLTVEQVSGAGQLQTNGGSWSYNANNALYSQLYGTLLTCSSSQYTSASYLTTMGIQLQLSPAAALLQTSAAMLNHPELLATRWELTFAQNPTIIDVNGDGILDWVESGGGTFNAASLGTSGDLGWTTNGTFLDTAPANNFATTTVVDLRWQNTTTGGNGATFSINALNSGSTSAPLLVYLALQADGTQTLSVNEQLASGSLQNLITIPGLPSAPIDLHMIIAPSPQGICVRVNNVYYGTFPLTLVPIANSAAYASLGASGSTAVFTYARIRVLNQ